MWPNHNSTSPSCQPSLRTGLKGWRTDNTGAHNVQHGHKRESTTPKPVTDLQQVGEVVNLRVQFHLEERPHSQHTHCPGNSSGASREPWGQAQNKHRLCLTYQALAGSLCSLTHTWCPEGCSHCRCTFVSQLLRGVSGEKPDHGQNWAATQNKRFPKGTLQAK